ncbi:serine/threonine-protein kinase 16-like [Watersipora subatra]|uniref:serine/threonine-protein kinase 16-like n=1 Tax=Watersipora subatra TaxID=2589382 RepID=UPI00355C5EB8
MLLASKVMGCICGKESLKIENQTYHVKSRLGEGGFSYVDLVSSARTHKTFALKRVMCHSKEDEKRFLAEVEYMRKFEEHPNIISLEGSEVVAVNNPASSIVSKIYILMPFYSSGTLQDQIETGLYLQQADLLTIIRDVAKAIKAFHSSTPKLAHRDIKPANVLLTEAGGAVLMDLGSMDKAVFHASSTSEGQRLQDDAAERCTMPYRAPELFNVQLDDTITELTDIWSFGCLIYACIYLCGPFDEIQAKGGSMALAAVGGNVAFPDQLKYSYKWVELSKSMLSVQADLRPSIDVVIDKLESIQNHLENRV